MVRRGLWGEGRRVQVTLQRGAAHPPSILVLFAPVRLRVTYMTRMQNIIVYRTVTRITLLTLRSRALCRRVSLTYILVYTQTCGQVQAYLGSSLILQNRNTLVSFLYVYVHTRTYAYVRAHASIKGSSL